LGLPIKQRKSERRSKSSGLWETGWKQQALIEEDEQEKKKKKVERFEFVEKSGG
jgi:hypothetical protein